MSRATGGGGGAPRPLEATWRVVTGPLRPLLSGLPVSEEEAATAHRRLAALDDAVFDGVALRLASEEGGAYLARLVTAGGGVALAARLARAASAATARACMAAVTALGGPPLDALVAGLACAPREHARRFERAAGVTWPRGRG